MSRTRGRAGILAVAALCALGYGSGAAGQGSGVPGGTLPYVPPAGRVGGLEGFVWVVNHAATPAAVEITGYDDTGERFGPVDLAMPASSSMRLLSEHLESGSAVDGLPVGLGDGTGDWRLELRSASHVEAVALVRTPDKFMTSLQAVVAPESEGATVYPVEVFNPGSNTRKASFLRLVNPGDAAASVTISGTDAGGAAAPGGDVRLTVPAGGAVRVTALELEVGESHLEGRLGDGAGKWRLRVASDRPLFVMNLLRSQTDSGLVYVSNLSVGAVRAPPPDDHGDTPATATLVQAGSTTAGALEVSGDKDLFRIDLTRSGRLTVWTTGETDTYGTLFRGGSAVATDDDDGDGANFSITVADAQAGTWYVEVKGNSAWATGGYTLEVDLSGPPPPPPPPSPGETFRDCEECPLMVVAPAGSFLMGSPESEEGRADDEGPVHPVTIGYPFAVGVYEVRFDEWDACVSGGGCGGYRPADEGWGRGIRPVINVIWSDAKSYVAWLSRKTGEGYRLLSESEWEYLARAGTVTRYWWGNEIGRNRANCYEGCGSRWDGDRTAPVGSFQANNFGLYDVHGNVWEWVEDCWNGSYRGAPGDGSAWTSGECSRRALRGGSWSSGPGNLRAADRVGLTAGLRFSGVGFRVARMLTP